MSQTLAKLVRDHNIRMTSIYTHTIDSGRDNRNNRDVYDLLLIITGEPSLYGGRSNERTMYVHGAEQAAALSRANNHDELIPFDTTEVMADLLSVANGIDNERNWRTWAIEYAASQTFQDGMDAYDAYQESRRLRDELLRFLGGKRLDLYDQFMSAERP